MNGSLDYNFLIDVIGQPIDIGDIQVVPVQGKETKKLDFTLTDTEDHQIACCLWGRFAEHMLYAYKVAQVNKNFLFLLRFAKINVYKGQVQITNAFDSSTIEINPPGFDVQDYRQVLPKNELALTTGSHELAKHKGSKRQPDKWFKLHLLIKDDTGETKVMLLDTIAEPILGVSAEVLLDGSLEEVSLVSMESEENTCLSSTPLSKRKGECEIDDFSSTSKKQCSKIMKHEKNPSMNRMKRKHQPRFEDDGHRLHSQSISKQRIDHSQRKDVPLSTVFRRLMSDITNNNVSSRFPHIQLTSLILFGVVCFDKKNNENPNDTNRVEEIKYNKRIMFKSCHISKRKHTKYKNTYDIHQNFIRWILLSIVCFTDLLRSIDECDDLEVECSSQESSDTEISDDEQSIVQEPLKEDQTERVSFLAALFKKNLSEVKKSPKPKVKAVSSSEYEV
ncbi:hypothetical protein HID58_075054 [Brassica napus]|uniref:DUF223 domain-containing protein n=1 Tax=Brassica napus TaxID=3708 RepID=A0ABQ7YK81_BRANA|nr:hypothetical protein HID58_075054 [Brassica napus]